MPLLVLGWDYTRDFWTGNWYLPLVFFLVMALLNLYFLMHWRLFSLLEKEDWSGIISHVLGRMENGRFRKQDIKICINAALVSSRLDILTRVEMLLREKKPAMLEEFVLTLGVPYILGSEPAKAEAFFREFLESKVKTRLWIVWSYGFSLLLQKKLSEAKVQFLSILDWTDPVLTLLNAYMLETAALDDVEAQKIKENMRMDLKKRFTREALEKEIVKARAEVHIVVLGKVVEEAVDWLYSALAEPQESTPGEDA